MKKIFTLAAAILASISLTWAADFTPTAVYTVGDATTLGANFKTGINQIANYFEVEDTVLFSPFVLYSSAAKNYQEWTGCAGSGSSGTTWEAITGRCFKGSAGMFSTSSKLATINTSRTYYYNITNCTQVMGLVKSSSSITITFGAYEMTGSEIATTPEKTATYKNGSFGVISLEGLNPEKTYQIKVSSDNSSNASFAEIAFVAPAKEKICPSNLTISGKKAYTEGEKIELTAALEKGNGAISYQWYKGSIAEENKIDGATTAKLEIKNCAAADAANYFCVASKADCEDAASAAYAVTVKTIEPIGDATITYALSGSTVTGTATGVNSISGLSTELTLSTLTLSGTKDGYSGAIKGCTSTTELVENDYVEVSFNIADGYVFTPSAISVKANPLGATGALKAVVNIMDSQTKVASEVLACAKNTDNEAQFAANAFDGIQLEGTIKIRAYFYGAASDKAFYIKSPITVTGTVAVAPTKYTVTFDANGGSGDMASLKYIEGAEVALPACTFTAPTGKEFDAWTSEDVVITDGKFTMPAKNVTVTATWKTEVIRYTVTYKHGDKTLGSEDVEANGSPANYATYQVLDDGGLSTFVAWYNDADLAEEHKVADIAAAVITEATTFYAKFDYKYSESINIEKWVMENGISKGKEDKTTELIKFMGTMKYAKSFAWESGNLELDSLNNDKGDLRNYAYLGLKVKKSGSQFRVRLAPSSTVKIKFGAYKTGSEPTVSINGGEKAPITIENNVYSYTATGEDLLTFNMKTADAVVLQQIAINEELADPALFAINCAAVENGTLAAAYKLGIPGETIALTVTPAGGYVVASVSVNSDPIAADGEGKYSFEMPAAVANVAAVFSVSTALDNTEAEVKAVKMVRDGQLLILKNGVLYNAQGAVVK